MRQHAWALGLALALGCGKENGGNPDAGGGPDTEDPNKDSPFTRLVVDSGESEFHPISSIALAVGPDDRIGMAYFVRTGTMTADVADYELVYREFNGGSLGSAERIAVVQRVYGVSLAFGPNGQPAVTYLGGGRDDSTFWFQSDLAVAYRNGPSSWTEHIAVRRSNEVATGNIVADAGFLVGLNPAIVFAGDQAIVAYRDGHNGNFERQDFAASDLELAVGGPSAWQHRMVATSSDNKAGYGGHISMVMAGAQPALVHDQAASAAHATGSNIHFQRRNADGTSWSAPVRVQQVGNTQLGASLAYDSEAGFGIASVDKAAGDRLTFIECAGTTGTACTAAGDWTSPDPVYQQGSGGWYPSLAFDPEFHEPAIAYYNCAREPGRPDTGCNPGDDELVVSTRISGQWRETLVDAGGGWSPKLAFLSSGKRVVLYRAPVVATDKGVLKLAVEQ